MRTLLIIVVMVVLLLVLPVLAQQGYVIEESRVSVDYVYNEDDGLVYLWCREGCARFLEWAALHDLSQGFEDTVAANEAVWAWQDEWLARNGE